MTKPSDEELVRLTRDFMVAVLELRHEGQAAWTHAFNRATRGGEQLDLNAAYRYPNTGDPFYVADLIADIAQRAQVETPLKLLIVDNECAGAAKFILNDAARTAELKAGLAAKAPRFATLFSMV